MQQCLVCKKIMTEETPVEAVFEPEETGRDNIPYAEVHEDCVDLFNEDPQRYAGGPILPPEAFLGHDELMKEECPF